MEDTALTKRFEIPRTPKKEEPPKPKFTQPQISVFNRTHGVMGFSEPEFGYVEIKNGRWTTEMSNKLPIPREFVYQQLMGNPDFSIHMPYKPYSANKGLTVASPIVSTTGWGLFAINTIEQLSYLRDDISLFPLANWYYDEVPERVQDLMRKPHSPTEWALALTIPSDLPAIPSRNVVLYSMWETAKLPQGWKELIQMNGVKRLIVPAKSQVDLFRQGFEGEIDVVPLGVNPEIWNFRARPQRGADEPFTIILYGTLSSRKAPMETAIDVCYKAFSSAFGEPIENWRLILKTRQGALSGIKALSDNHIEIINRDYTPEQMADLVEKADVGVFLSRYEGYGLGMRESMASGLPVIVSDNSGHSDDCDPMLNIPIHCELEVPAQEAYANEMEQWNWYEPNWDDAARELRHQYELWEMRGRTQSEMGKIASDFILKNRLWKHTAQHLQDILTNRIHI